MFFINNLLKVYKDSIKTASISQDFFQGFLRVQVDWVREAGQSLEINSVVR
jgi:hypothetical protein